MKTRRCGGRRCKLTYCPNFVWVNGKKKNTASLHVLEQLGVAFISNKRAFTRRYLRYQQAVVFHNFVSARGASWVIKETFADPESEGHGQELKRHHAEDHMDGIMYLLAVQELEAIGEHLSVTLGKEVTEDTFAQYNTHMHTHVLTADNPHDITVLVGDGHEKVLTKCSKSMSATHTTSSASSRKALSKPTALHVKRAPSTLSKRPAASAMNAWK